MTTMDESQRALVQFDCLIDLLCETYVHLREKIYPNTQPAEMTRTVGFITAAGIRHLKAARGDLDQGWEPESSVHLRAAFGATMDLGFLLSLPSNERNEMARQYHAMRWLRTKMLRETMQENPERHSDDHRLEYEELMAEYAESPGLDTREHWSGKNQAVVFDAAHRYFDKGVGELRADNLTRQLKRLSVDQVGTVSVHADPAALLFICEDDGWPSIEPEKGKFDHGYGYCLIACCLLLGSTRRANKELQARAFSLLEEVGKMVEGRANQIQKDEGT